MAKNTRDKASRTATLAAPIRELFRSLVRNKIQSEADKRELAKYLNRSVSFVNQLIYYGEGGMDAWIGALAFTFKIDTSKCAALIRDYALFLRKLSPLSEADKTWFSLDKTLSEEDKLYWLGVIQAAIEIESSHKSIVISSNGSVHFPTPKSSKKKKKSFRKPQDNKKIFPAPWEST